MSGATFEEFEDPQGPRPNRSRQIDAKLDLVRLYRQKGETGRAIEQPQQVARLDPDRPDVHYFLFEEYRNAGNMDQARKELEIFQSLNAKSQKSAPPPSQ